ncbi:MAG: cytochrome-c peroxidase [Pseudomonadota bacterium]
MNRGVWAIVLSVTMLALAGCEGEGASGAAPELPYTAFFSPLPEAPLFPTTNAFSDEKRTLGEFLFWDPILSGQMNVSCASCHHPEFAWSDGRPKSIGADGQGLGPERVGQQVTPFHSPTVLDSGFAGIGNAALPTYFESGPYFWDARAATLEAQALDPIRSALEMRGPFLTDTEIFPEIVSRLNAIPEYQTLFQAAFEGPDPISMDNVAKALATFQRTLISAPTRFDAFLAGDESALTADEVTGLNKFINAGCTDCHSGPMLSDFIIRPTQPVLENLDAVRTAPLRNVALTPPYMQDGSQATLRDAVALYEDRDDLGVTLEDDDFGDIERFLNTVNTSRFYGEVPTYVPSQLPVGGDILGP